MTSARKPVVVSDSRSSSSSTMIRSPMTETRPADAPSNSSSRRASLRWLRSWYSSARSYSRRAADSSSSSVSEIGWPAAHESAAAAYGSSRQRDALLGRDPGDLEQVALGGRLGGHPGGLAGGLGERGVDVGRVVELDELGGGLDDLGLADPLAGHVVEVAAAAAERQVGRDRQVVGLVVDERQAAEDRDPVLVVVEEAAELFGRLDDEVGALEGGIRRELPEQVVVAIHEWSPPFVWSGKVYGWYSRSGPIRSRRNIEWWRSKIHSPARWPSARVASSASSLSRVA